MREITKKHNDRHFGFGKAQSDRGNEDVRHRHLRRAFWRGGVAVLLAAALVVSDALPVGPPVGLPDTVKAADPTPKTGTITFYEYQLRRYDNAWAREYFSTSYQDAYSSTSGLFIYEYDGTCYAVMNELTSDGKWPTCKVDVFGWEYTPGADVFYARTMPRTYDLYKHDKYFAINLVADDVGYKYYGIDGNSNGIYHYEIARNDGSTNNWYRPKWWMILQTTNKIRVYNSQTSLCGRDSYIGSGSEDT